MTTLDFDTADIDITDPEQFRTLVGKDGYVTYFVWKEGDDGELQKQFEASFHYTQGGFLRGPNGPVNILDAETCMIRSTIQCAHGMVAMIVGFPDL